MVTKQTQKEFTEAKAFYKEVKAEWDEVLNHLREHGYEGLSEDHVDELEDKMVDAEFLLEDKVKKAVSEHSEETGDDMTEDDLDVIFKERFEDAINLALKLEF